ncbi:UHRF1-binding protein 1-like [Toxocara canis]|uniref:UHRF1-binding protein 1-like n=1 Tax=Toxocara canis TaxID=6265 RepID=A0A0B2VMP4_TOXCA|nr:UHRF1-binding protein 1-like [Toxocara canis]
MGGVDAHLAVLLYMHSWGPKPFARNVTPDQISVQILSGKGELKNIELNEVVLTEVLELPTWLRVKRARCNRVAVKVPWTRLKSSPVQLVGFSLPVIDLAFFFKESVHMRHLLEITINLRVIIRTQGSNLGTFNAIIRKMLLL